MSCDDNTLMKSQISIFKDWSKVKRWVVLVAVLLPTACSQRIAIKPFTTDGCSAFPDGSPTENTVWLSCCEAHDLAYWKGGTRKQRAAADEELEQFVSDVGEPV